MQYEIRMVDNKPIKSYVLRCTPDIVEAINEEISKLEKAEFIEPSISPFVAPTVCVEKEGCESTYLH